MITRRAFVLLPVGGGRVPPPALTVPVHRIFDRRAKLGGDQQGRFFSIWWEAVQNFRRCGVEFRVTAGEGEIRRSPSGQPQFSGLQPAAVNLVLTDGVPLAWDRGRGLAGLTTRYDGHVLCVIAAMHAHPHRIPLLAVNTCVHELLHVLLGDVWENRPAGLSGQSREWRIDAHATRLWLFGEGGAVREGARRYLSRAAQRPPR